LEPVSKIVFEIERKIQGQRLKRQKAQPLYLCSQSQKKPFFEIGPICMAVDGAAPFASCLLNNPPKVLLAALLSFLFYFLLAKRKNAFRMTP
jgi:hypothetical protein